MSLKTFHIIFIIASSLFMIYFSFWSYTQWQYYHDQSYLSYLILSIVSFILLLFYSRVFIKKLKGLIN